MMNLRRNSSILPLLFVFLLGASGCSAKETLQKSYGEAMGTSLMLAYYAPQPRPEILEKALTLLNKLEAEMTIWDRPVPSEIMKLNSTSGKSSFLLPPDSTFVLRTALKYAKLSGGALDPTVGPFVKLWGVATDHPKVPAQADLERDFPLVDWNLVEDRADGFYLPKEGMILDLGAIAKGYAADKLKKLFLAEGLKSGIIDLGGNIFLVGSKQDGSPWKVGVQDPLQPRGAFLGIIPVKDKSLVTSGIYERFFEENGKKYHHILNAKTGYPEENDLAGVTIVHNPSIEADALSTAVFVLGLKKGWDLVLSQPGVEAVFVTRDRKVYITPGLVNVFELTGKYELVPGRP